jgi:PTS system ascorbate-specific IIC component
MVMFCAFAINLLLAKFTRLKGVYLTGHHYLYMSLFAVMILQTRSGLPTHLVVILGAVILGVYGWLTVVATRRVTEKTTGMSGVGMANSSASAALIGAFTARICGRQEDRYEPGDRLYWSNISSIPVGAAICTFVVYVILACFAGFGQAETIFKSGNWFVNCLFRSLLYGAQIALLLYGIRMLLASVIEMFWSVANKCVGGLWTGLDALVMISYMPRAWGVGFLTSCAGSVAAMAVMIALKTPFVPLLSVTSLYFAGGVAGVCGNAYGGKRGTKLAGLLTGVLVTLLIGCMAAHLYDHTELGVMFGETEYGIYGLILELIGGFLK